MSLIKHEVSTITFLKYVNMNFQSYSNTVIIFGQRA